MATSLFDNPVVVALIMLGVIGFVVSALYKRKMGNDKFKDFQPKRFSATTLDEMRGKIDTQGTTYNITYESQEMINYKDEVEYLLAEFDTSLSTYNPLSVITNLPCATFPPKEERCPCCN